jgi:hypothetical protein
MALIGETDSRPGLIGYEETNKPLYSDFEVEETKKHIQEYEQNDPETIFDLSLNEIVENTVEMIANFSNDYYLKVNEVDLESKLYGEKETFLVNLQKYLLGFMLYLGDKNNLLYFGILLIIFSIILYFFNISSTIKIND